MATRKFGNEAADPQPGRPQGPQPRIPTAPAPTELHGWACVLRWGKADNLVATCVQM